MSERELDTCGCCEGEDRLTPADTHNRPGLGALAYRVGTHATFFETMVADLAGHVLVEKTVDREGHTVESRSRPLARLKTRRRDDFSIALLDAWATIADVLTFYQERIANEGYLRTATELRSVLELARLVGYAPAPGVAASTYLSFTVEDSEKAALIPKGTRVQSVPQPGETMQSFETMDDLEARYEYNTLKVRLAQPQWLRADDLPDVLYLPGQRNDLKPPDRILLAFGTSGLSETFAFGPGDNYFLARVKSAGLLSEPARTAVSLESDIHEIIDASVPAPMLTQLRRATLPRRVAYLKQPWRAVEKAIVRKGTVTPLRRESIAADARNQDVGFQGAAALNREFADRIYKVLGQEVAPLEDTEALRAVVLLRLQAHLHGHKAPWRGQSQETSSGSRVYETVLSEWPDQDKGDDSYQSVWGSLFRAEDGEQPAVATLDGAYEQIGAGSLVVLAWPDYERERGQVQRLALYRVQGIDQVSTGLFNVSATATRLHMKKIKGYDWNPVHMATIRSTAVYAAVEFVTGAAPHRILDLAPLSDEYTVSDADLESGDAWQAIAKRYGLPAELLAAANNMTTGCELRAKQTLAIPVGRVLELDGVYKGLQPGRYVALSGTRTDIPVAGHEVALVQAVEHRFATVEGGMDLPGDVRHTFVKLAQPPGLPYQRATLRLSANVVKATHGEAARGVPPREKDVVLGSGDGAEAHQRFALKLLAGKRLTYLSAPTASGVESTLQVYVGDVLWQARETLMGAAGTDHVYTLQCDDEGKVTVVLGDGVEGARPPTGQDNVRARYRVGIGQDGNVDAGQISLLATRPPGVKEVSNWVPATGGTDPEDRDQARQNVGFAARTLGRLVGLQDYQDFSRTFAGVAKARAEYDANACGKKGKVTVYVAGQDGAPLEGSDVQANLKKALDAYDGSNVAIEVGIATLRLISLDATVQIAPDRLWERVEPAIRAALETRFAFGRRELGQDVALSDIVCTIQSVPGVRHVRVTHLDALTKEELEAQAAGETGATRPLDEAVLAVDHNELAYIDPDVPSLIVLQNTEA